MLSFLILSTIKVKFGQKLVCCMKKLSNMFLAHFFQKNETLEF